MPINPETLKPGDVVYLKPELTIPEAGEKPEPVDIRRLVVEAVEHGRHPGVKWIGWPWEEFCWWTSPRYATAIEALEAAVNDLYEAQLQARRVWDFYRRQLLDLKYCSEEGR